MEMTLAAPAPVRLPTVEPHVISRYAKYTNKNLISTRLLTNFFATIDRLVEPLSFQSVLEVGCGEGILLHHLRHRLVGKTVHGIDLNPEEIEIARHNVPNVQTAIANAYALPFPDHSLDLVLCCEVMEHLDEPERALREIRRVASGYCIFSVPREPLWRMLNMARGAYLKDFGNTPTHYNHWSARGFVKFVEQHFEVLRVEHPLPWTAVLCRVK